MKKLFAIVMTLLLVFSLPLFAMAEEATTAETSADTTVEEVTTVETSADTTVETSADTTVEEATTVEETITAPESTENTTEESTEPETEPEIRFGFYPETALVTLPIMGMGMLGIFLVTLVIILTVLVLSKIGKEKEEE